MKHHVFSRRLGAVAIAIALAFVLSAVSTRAQPEGGTPTPRDPCVTAQPAGSQGSEATPAGGEHDMGMNVEFDLMFIDMMIPHHQEAADMAQVALNRSTNDEVRQLAEEISAAQTAEIAQMTEWRDAWYPDAPPVPEDQASQMMMDMEQSGMMAMETGAMLVDLCEADDVDAAFLELMIPHHASAIGMAEMALTGAVHDELRELAEVIVETQSAEIIVMQELLSSITGTPVAMG